MKRTILTFLLCSSMFGATEPINVNTADGFVKKTSSGVGEVGKPFDFSNVSVTGIGGAAPGTAHYVTTQSESSLTNEFNLGALSAGILRITISTGVATPTTISIPADATQFLNGATSPAYAAVKDSDLAFTDITTNDVSISKHGFTPKLPGDDSVFFNGAGDYVAIPGSGSGVSQLISGGGVAWTGTGFNYIISAATYMINGTQYASAQTPVTLSAADATDDRIDVFYVDDSGTAGVIEGTPGTPPVQPSVDPGSQLQLTFAYIVAASTAPVITNENIYLENTEYTMSVSAGTINPASTSNPYAGTKDIEGTSVANATFFTATKPSGTLDLSGYTQLTFQIRSKAAWPNAKAISIFWLNGTTVVGSSLALKQGTFGFDSSNTSSYQQIVIPAANFGTGTNAVNKLRMTVSGGGANIGWYIDNIILQTGGGGGGGGTVTNFTAGNLSPLFTTTVTSPTTTPNLAFSLSTASAHNYFGNNTGSTAAPAFHQIGYAELSGTPAPITPAALTKTDDTNVTLTLGGTPTTALLQASSLTLGWTGTLSIARGGFGKAMTDPNADKLAGWDDTDGDFEYVTVGTGLSYTHATHTLAATAQAQNHAVSFVVDGSGGVLSTGTKNPVKIPYGGTLTGWLLIVKPSGSVTVDILRAADGAGLPVTSIIGGGGTKPAVSSAVENSSTSFTSWTSTTLTAKDNMAISLSGITTSTYCALTLYYQ